MKLDVKARVAQIRKEQEGLTVEAAISGATAFVSEVAKQSREDRTQEAFEAVRIELAALSRFDRIRVLKAVATLYDVLKEVRE